MLILCDQSECVNEKTKNKDQNYALITEWKNGRWLHLHSTGEGSGIEETEVSGMIFRCVHGENIDVSM